MRCSLHVVLACAVLIATAAKAHAHCCHDDRLIGVSEQSSAPHGLAGGDSMDGLDEGSSPPTVGGGLSGDQVGVAADHGIGHLNGGFLGAYGTGSRLGTAGTGGIGTMQGTGVGAPAVVPRSRPR
jgi:hypothetical protein